MSCVGLVCRAVFSAGTRGAATTWVVARWDRQPSVPVGCSEMSVLPVEYFWRCSKGYKCGWPLGVSSMGWNHGRWEGTTAEYQRVHLRNCGGRFIQYEGREMKEALTDRILACLENVCMLGEYVDLSEVEKYKRLEAEASGLHAEIMRGEETEGG